ncbi:MAG TPA: hypothetical protein VHP38_01645 [Ruminiclostridium sp.]|nr:hypothetical protein [Ruminiclostridium sp.]
MAKLFVHILTLIPFVFVDSIIVAFNMNTGFLGFVIVLLLCSMFVILSGLVGSIYNLHFPL